MDGLAAEFANIFAPEHAVASITALVSVILIDLALVFALRREGLPLLEAELIAIPVAMVANYALTTRFAFRARRSSLGSSRAQA